MLNKEQLKARFESIFNDLRNEKTVSEAAAQMADAIDEYVKTAVVTVTTTCSAGGGTGTGMLE